MLYTIGSFTQKNDNTIPKDLTNTLMKSSVELLVSIMKEVSDANALQEKMKKKAVTVAGDFAKSMSALTNELGRSQCSYIRCVKPNAMMKPGVFDQQYVVTQLRCLGLLQTCEVLKVGLPTRVPYAQLRDQFESHMPKGVRDMYKHRGDKEFTMAALDVFEVSRDHYHLGYTRLFFRPGRFTELDRVLKSCRSVPANDLADLMKRRLMRRLWRLMLCRVRVGLMWIGMLRKMREKRAKAMMLLKKNLRRKKVVRDWAALIMAEGERQEKEIRENKAATAITMCFFNWCCRKSRMFKVRHPNGPRKKVDAIADEQREIEMTEQQIKEHHENFKLQAARLREIGGEAEMRRFREQEVARITPTDMDRRIQALQGALKAFTNQDNDDTTSVQDNVSETGSTTKLPITDNTRFRSYKRPVYNRQVEHSAAFTPSLLAQNRIDSAMESSIQALTAMTKQLVIMNPIDKLVKLNHELHVANKRRPFSSKSSFRIKDAAMVLETMAREDAQVKACGMLLFDAEVVLHNLFELQRWHRTRSEVNENRQYNFKSPSTFAHHNLKVENVIGPYGNPGHRFHFQRKALNY